MTDDFDALIGAMTLEEKAGMAAGSGLWYSSAVPRLDVPAYKLSDGPNGVRGESRSGQITSASFPVGVCLAATWDPALIALMGDALADECEAKDVQVLLGPTVNLHRSPLAGRNFECYSEDPFLTAEIAVALIRAVQARGVACCIKHFVCNDQEFERRTISAEVDERTLRELYCYPFERAVLDAGVWAVMSAYNRINGVSASAHAPLLRDTLKGEWGFDGVVVSDWGGTYDTEGPATAGLDLEMPGPALHMGAKLAAAVTDGRVDETLLDDKVRRHLRLLERTGRFGRTAARGETSDDEPAHRALIRRLAGAGAVLLKNDGGLPLEDPHRLALIGPNAVTPRILGGGSSTVRPHHVVTPEEGLRRAFPGAGIVVREGCTNFRHLPLIPPADLNVPGEEREGWRASFYNGFTPAAEPALVKRPRRSELLWFGNFAPELGRDFCVRLESRLTPAVSGVYRFSLISAGLSRLSVNGQPVVDNWRGQTPGDAFFGNGSTEVFGEIALTGGVSVDLEVEYSSETRPRTAGLRIGMLPPEHEGAFEDAVAAAADADAAVLVVGLNSEWESEGFDRADLSLPGRQAALIRAVAAVQPRTVVVLNAGSPVALDDWADEAASILQIWYPGQEAGDALADVLSGRVNPSGRLPTTIPRRLEDNPSFDDFPGADGRVRYAEGVHVGYRHYDTRDIEPAFPFGHGLSYTRFDFHGLALLLADDTIEVRLEVTNAGDRDGAEVVQVYARALDAGLDYPRRLAGFLRVVIGRGETCPVTVAVRTQDLRARARITSAVSS